MGRTRGDREIYLVGAQRHVEVEPPREERSVYRQVARVSVLASYSPEDVEGSTIATTGMDAQLSKPRARFARGFLLAHWLARQESLPPGVRESGSEQGRHAVGAPNVLTLHPGIGLFHQAVSLAARDLFSQSASCGGGVKAQSGRLKATGCILQNLTCCSGIVASHGNSCTDQLCQRLRPGDSLALEQTCVLFSRVQQRGGLRGGRGCGESSPGAKVEEEDAHLLDA